jgi:hypothetical protein
MMSFIRFQYFSYCVPARLHLHWSVLHEPRRMDFYRRE